jgi:A/G-specific adenine glycosylase
MQPARVRPRLLRWFDRHRRDLPWRRTTDPYAIWVSEVMLQQTQTATVIPYYRRFLERFPDARALASAREDEVLSVWSGLGYYRRARMLHAGASEVVRRHDGRVPDDPNELMELPGIGRYTAGAIASIAYGKSAPVLDGNVRRVLSRLCAIDATECGRGEEQRRLWAIAADLADGPRPGDLNQALMELGAVVCTPKRPACGDCPIESSCKARREGLAEAYPGATKRPPATKVEVAVAWLTRGAKLVLERRDDDGPLRGEWDLPARVMRSATDAGSALSAGLEQRHGLHVEITERLGTLSHGIMNRRLRLEVHACRPVAGRVRGDLRWVHRDDLVTVPISGATRKIVRSLTPD